jgi:hypothetical protein
VKVDRANRCGVGVWSAQVIIKAEGVPTDVPAAMAMITNKASLELFSHLNQYELEVGQEVGIVANLFDKTTLIVRDACTLSLHASVHAPAAAAAAESCVRLLIVSQHVMVHRRVSAPRLFSRLA